jgi:hypothetical protein
MKPPFAKGGQPRKRQGDFLCRTSPQQLIVAMMGCFEINLKIFKFISKVRAKCANKNRFAVFYLQSL